MITIYVHTHTYVLTHTYSHTCTHTYVRSVNSRVYDTRRGVPIRAGVGARVECASVRVCECASASARRRTIYSVRGLATT